MLSISSSARGGSSVSADHDDGIGHDIGDGGSGNSKEWTHMERTAGEPRGEVSLHFY